MDSAHRDIALELLSEAVREDGESLRLQVRGVCMVPLVQDGDWVQVRPLEALPQQGELVLARDPRDQLVCHRILGRRGDRLCLAGDRTLALEEHAPETVLGVVLRIERPDETLNLEQRSSWARRLDRVFARWHLLSYRSHGSFVGRLLEAVRWRVVVRRHRWAWRDASPR